MKVELVNPAAAILTVLVLLSLSSCATNSSETPPAGSILQGSSLSDPPDVVEARRVFKSEMERTPLAENVVFHTQPGEARYIKYTDPANKRVDVIQLTSLLPDSIVVSYKPGAAFRYPAWKLSYTDYVQKHKYYWLSSSWTKADAESAAKALKVLVLDARRDLDQTLAANLEKFRQSCMSWRALEEKPAIPEEVQRHKALAEDAYREKKFDQVANEYLDALKIYPCWPEGQFNAASILGDTGWYTAAVAHMQYYLELAPDASNAQLARDKIAAWQGRIGR